jgi:hypothetical protein
MHNNKAQRNRPGKPSRFWILGAGRFGQIALKRIRENDPEAAITVVDQKPVSFACSGVSVIQEDANAWLKRMLVKDAPVDVLVPAVPEHVVAAWLSCKLEVRFDVDALQISDRWLATLPNACRGGRGRVYVSHADFICPDDCPEPKQTCTRTGRVRPMDLFRLLKKSAPENIFPIVLRSHQLLPGVGGIYPADLWWALDTAIINCHQPLMIATACRCHGVVDFLRLKTDRPPPSQTKPFS